MPFHTRVASILLAAGVASFSLADPPAPEIPDHRESALMPAEHHREAFRPSIHGFKFHNSFTGSPVPARYRNLADMVGIDLGLNAPMDYGLCGGMSASAADFYLAGRDLPTRSTPPGEGDALFDYLSTRQVDSLGPAFVMALKFAEWMTYKDHDAGVATSKDAAPPPSSSTPASKPSSSSPSRGSRYAPPDIAIQTAAELPAIYDKLDNGELVVLGLVFVKAGTGMLWENHQVLAYSYDRDDNGASLKIYDPNYPSDDGVVITIRPYEPGSEALKCELQPTRRRAKPVRGLFEMPYTPKTPPAALSK